MLTVVVCVLQIDEEVSKLLQLKAQIGGDDGKHQFVLKTAKVRRSSAAFKHTTRALQQYVVNMICIFESSHAILKV